MQQFGRLRRPRYVDFDEFVTARADALMRYAYVLTGNPHDAADLLQESLSRMRSAWHRIGREPEGYARTTIARLHVSAWRRRRRERLMATTPDQEYREEGFSRADGDDGLWDALRALPPRQRAVLVLRYYEAFTDEEISEVLGISRGTVRSQASRALDRLRTTWRPAMMEGSTR